MALTTSSKASAKAKRAAAPPDDPVTAYARAVVEGRVRAGRAVRLAGARHLADLKTGATRGLRFDREAAQHALDFFPRFLRLAEGVHAGQPFVLQPWQQFIVGSLFGWMGPDGFRRFRLAYIEVGKGNGKTPMAAGIGLYGLVADDEAAAEIYAAAVTFDQAMIAWRDADRMVAASPALAQRIDRTVRNLALLPASSFFRPISSEHRQLDGKRVHMALIDEIHEHPNALVVDKMRAGTKGRRQALIVEITNSGYDRHSVCWQHHEYSLRILEGIISPASAESWFAYVCQLDEGDAWADPGVWIKPNPNLGISVTEKYLREQVEEAQGMPSKEAVVRRLNFCEWTESHSPWMPSERWAACGTTVPDAELVAAPCYAGLDLGQSDDFTAFIRVWMLADGRVAVRARYWIPDAALTRRKFRPYAEWLATGLLAVNEGDVVDYARVQADVAALCQESGVRECAYDRRFAEQMAQNLSALGIEMVDTPQGYQLNAALCRLLDLVKTERLCHGGDPILAWMARNAVVRHGTQGEIRLDKPRAEDKIDAVAALAMALTRAMGAAGASVYETRGLLAV